MFFVREAGCIRFCDSGFLLVVGGEPFGYEICHVVGVGGGEVMCMGGANLGQ